MRIIIDIWGSVHKLNEYDQHHSFDGKPAYIGYDGELAWYTKGTLTKIQRPGEPIVILRH